MICREIGCRVTRTFQPSRYRIDRREMRVDLVIGGAQKSEEKQRLDGLRGPIYQKKRTHTRLGGGACVPIEISHRANSRPNGVTCTEVRCRDKCQLGKRERVRICCRGRKTRRCGEATRLPTQSTLINNDWFRINRTRTIGESAECINVKFTSQALVFFFSFFF